MRASTVYKLVLVRFESARNLTLLVAGWRSALFTMMRAVLGDFDADAALTKTTSIAMYVLFQLAVVVLMMNLLIAIMAGAHSTHNMRF